MKVKSLLAAIIFLSATSSSFAAGLTINVPLVGRVVGGGGVLFATSLDISNNASTAVTVDFYFDGADARTGQVYGASGSLGNGGFTSRGATLLSPRVNLHLDDAVSALVDANVLPVSVLDNGITGSILVVFNGLTKSGQGAITARFYNALAGGSVGVSLRGHEVTENEPKRLVATLRDTIASAPAAAQTYPNMFINHTGLTPSGSRALEPITIRVSAVSAATGEVVGNTNSYTIGSGQTITIGRVFQALGISNTADNTIIVTVVVTSGNAAIAGIVSQVDNGTRDGAAFEMARADF